MTTNKPGSVNQQPLYGCTSCYEEVTYPAGDLGVYGGECWCECCWDNRSSDFTDQPEWNDLEPFTPALQAERDSYKNTIKEVTTRHFAERWSKTAADKELEQYLSDGIAQLEDEHRKQIEALQAECEKLEEDLDKTELRALKFIHQCNAHVELYRELKDERDQLRDECEKLRKDAERIEWLEDQTKKSRTGISFDYHRYAEDGYVVDHGYRFMRRHFASGFKDSLRKAIDATMETTK